MALLKPKTLALILRNHWHCSNRNIHSENIESIELFYLPSYSPEKNPDEYLNCDLKHGLSDTPSPRNEKQLRSNVEKHMLMLQGDEERVKKYFKNEDIKYV